MWGSCVGVGLWENYGGVILCGRIVEVSGSCVVVSELGRCGAVVWVWENCGGVG